MVFNHTTKGKMFQLALLILLAMAPLTRAYSDDSEKVYFPIANIGVSYPNGFEVTGGVLFGTTKYDSIEGPAVAFRFNSNADGFGLSAGPGYIAQLSLVGFGAQLWLSRNFQKDHTQSNSVSLEGYFRIILLEFRVGLVTNFANEVSAGPIVGINLGI